MLAVGQAIEGDFNDEDKTLDVSGLKTVQRLADLYRHGDLVLALAERVSATEAVLTLYPGFSRTVTAAGISSNPVDTVDSLITEGDVVVTRFLRESGAVVLSLIDVDEDAVVVEAPALLEGGTPWLQDGRHLVEHATSAATSDARAAAVDVPGAVAGVGVPALADRRPGSSTALASVQLQLESERRKAIVLQELIAESGRTGAELVGLQTEYDALRRKLEGTLREAEAATTELEEARRRLNRQAEELRTLRTSNRSARQAVKRAEEDPSEWFQSEDERLRHDVYLAWARNVPASEKGRLGLPSVWNAGPDFAESLCSFKEPGVRSKALKAVVEVLTGAADSNGARELHALRSSAGGDAAQVRRPDGARCFRVAIEQNVAAARRLHFWKLPDGTVELSRVVVHEDFRP